VENIRDRIEKQNQEIIDTTKTITQEYLNSYKEDF